MSSIKSHWTLNDPDSSVDIRDSLVHFWISSPIDKLELFWNSGFGSITTLLVKQLDNNSVFTEEQVQLRNEIGSFFGANGLNHPYSPQLMIANFLLSPPGLLKINNVASYFPRWLADVYIDLYENPQSSSSSSSPLTSGSIAPPSVTSSPVPDEVSAKSPNFGNFPSSLAELVNDRIHLNRLLGLSNLFYIDPDDREVMAELLEVRQSLANAIFSCPESDLQTLWSTSLGDRYWSLVRSGIQSQLSSPVDISLKDKATQMLDPSKNGGFGTPSAVNAFLVALLYYIPGSVRIEDADSKVPGWLLSSYKEIFEIPTEA